MTPQASEQPLPLATLCNSDWPPEVSTLLKRIQRSIHAAQRRGLSREQIVTALFEAAIICGGADEAERDLARLDTAHRKWAGHPHQCPTCHRTRGLCMRYGCREALMQPCYWCRTGTPRPASDA